MAKQIINHFKKNYVKYLILAIIIYFVFSDIFWLAKDNTPTRWDDSWNLLVSNYYYKLLIGQENRSSQKFAQVFPAFGYATNSYPPFFKLCSVPLYLLFGFSPDIGIMTNLLFYLILIYCVFFLTKKLMNANAALFATFLVSTMPLLVGLSRVYLLDFALTSMIFLGLTLFIKSENFSSRKYTIFFAIIFSLGMLTKMQYSILMAPTIIFLMILDIKKKKWKIAQTENLLIMVFISSIIFFPWFLGHSLGAFYYLIKFSSKEFAAIEGDPAWNSWGGLIYYIVSASNGVSFFYYALFIIALIVVIYALYKNKDFLNEKNEIILGLLFFIVSVTIIFTYVANKDHRFITSIYPAIAIITSIGLWKIKLNQKIRPVIIVFIIIFGLIQIHGYTSGYNIFKKNINAKSGFYIFTNYNQYLVPPSTDNWKIEEILFLIKKDANENQKKYPVVAIYSDTQQFNPINFQMYAYSNNIPLGYLNLGFEEHKEYDYIIIKEGYIRIESLKTITEKIMKDKSYLKLKEFNLPDRSLAKIYKKI